MKKLRNQKGVTIIAVFFVLLILGALGMAVSKLTQSQQLQSAKAIQVQTAYYNARSGLEWAYQYMIENGLDNTQLASLVGTYTLPDGQTFTITTGTTSVTSTASVGDGKRSVTFAAFGDNFSPGGGGDDTQPPDVGGESGDGADSCSGSLDLSTTIFPDSTDPPYPNYADFPEYDPAAWPDGDNLGAINMASTDTLTLDSGTYLIDSLTMAGQSELTFTGDALVYVKAGVSISGQNITTVNPNIKVKFIVLGDVTATGNANLAVDDNAEIDIAASGTITTSQNSGFACP